MKPNSLAARDIASVLHPQTNLKKHLDVGPNIITGADGVHIFDDSGNRFLDSGAGLWCTALGYNSERIAKVAYDAMKELAYYQIFRHASHTPAIELSEKLLEISPVPMSKVMLQCSGSEANDTAVKVVWYYWHGKGQPERRKIISRMGSYHGSTCVAVSLTGNPKYHSSFGLPFDGFLKVSRPNFYRDAELGETEEVFAQRLADELEDLILSEGPETVAAFWADPIQGNAGALPPPAGYFEKIQKVLKKYGILFVADEVICGFGRTGNLWGTQTYDLKPDIITCAKGLSAAMQPISAVLLNDMIFDVMVSESDRIGAFVHGYTYAGHPVACSVALEVLKIYEEMDIVGHVRSLEGRFLNILDELSSHPIAAAPGGAGLLGGFEIVADKEARTSFPAEVDIAGRLDEAAQAEGLILRIASDRVAFSPPLIISEPELDEMAEKTHAAMDKVHRALT